MSESNVVYLTAHNERARKDRNRGKLNDAFGYIPEAEMQHYLELYSDEEIALLTNYPRVAEEIKSTSDVFPVHPPQGDTVEKVCSIDSLRKQRTIKLAVDNFDKGNSDESP